MIKKNNSFRRNRSKSLNKNGINGYENKIFKQKPKGNPLEIKMKYENLAKDASSAGDKVAAENYMQHAEHFLRINNSNKKVDKYINDTLCINFKDFKKVINCDQKAIYKSNNLPGYQQIINHLKKIKQSQFYH